MDRLRAHVSLEVTERIAHASKGSIDTDPRLLCDFLEAKFLPVAQAHDLLLLGREATDART